MKKFLSILLAAVLLCGLCAVMSAATDEPEISLDKQYYDFNNGTFSIEVSFKNLPSSTAWFGVYPASLTAFTTADSHAFWCYANATLTAPAETPADGTFTLSSSLCTDGCALIKADIDNGITEFQVVMFYNDSDRVYEPSAVAKFTFGEAPVSDDSEGSDSEGSDTENPDTGSTGAVIAVVAAAAAVTLGAALVVKKVRA